jgi:hypothetical protein
VIAAALAPQAVGTRPWRLLVADARATTRASALAGPRATLTAFADGPVELDPTALSREVAVTGVAGAHPALVVEVAALVARGELDLAGAVELRALAALPGGAATDRALVVIVG